MSLKNEWPDGKCPECGRADSLKMTALAAAKEQYDRMVAAKDADNSILLGKLLDAKAEVEALRKLLLECRRFVVERAWSGCASEEDANVCLANIDAAVRGQLEEVEQFLSAEHDSHMDCHNALAAAKAEAEALRSLLTGARAWVSYAVDMADSVLYKNNAAQMLGEIDAAIDAAEGK